MGESRKSLESPALQDSLGHEPSGPSEPLGRLELSPLHPVRAQHEELQSLNACHDLSRESP